MTKQQCMENNENKVSTKPEENEKLIDDSEFELEETSADAHELEGNKKTYYSAGSEDSGVMEIDLVTFRERGTETRYIGIGFSGLNVKVDPPEPQEAFYNIETESEFNEFKNFITNLNWND